MKKVLALTLCLMLLPTFAFAYTFGKTGTVKESILGLQVPSISAQVDLYDDTAGGSLVATTLCNTFGQYAVSCTKPFPNTIPPTLFFIQKCHMVVTSALPGGTKTGRQSQWIYINTKPDETKSLLENFNIVFP